MTGLFKNNRPPPEAGLKKKVTPYEWSERMSRPGLTGCRLNWAHAVFHVLCAVVRIGQGLHEVGRH